MSEDRIKMLYVCPVCQHSFGEKKAAEACLRAHESEMIYRQLELRYVLGCTRYGFSSNACRRDANYRPNTKVDAFGLYNGYPQFATECLDNESDILAAKKWLIEAAHRWAEKYNEVLAGLERDLEAEE